MERVILVIDDEPSILRSLKRVFRHDWTVLATDNIDQALSWLEEYEVAVVLSDYRMPVMTGVELLGKVKAAHPATQRYLLSGQADFDTVSHSITSGACHRFLCKPWKDDQLRAHADEGWHTWCQQRATTEQNELPDAAELINLLTSGQLTLRYRLETTAPSIRLHYCIAIAGNHHKILSLATSGLSQAQLDVICDWATALIRTVLTLHDERSEQAFQLHSAFDDTVHDFVWLSWRDIEPHLSKALDSVIITTELPVL